ncbi:hypothetical protein V7S43_010664 [Phytophthora oleae]|uniref:Uncharacterized protein n=1 Tax=Phytophthora oleae TaxID=2107226 RepID=A0ABD3FEJ9_9STRA
MVRLESGRVVNDDLATIEVVLRSIRLDSVPFAIIVNNLKKRQYAEIMENGPGYEEIVKLMNSIKYKTPHIVFVPVIDALDEEDDAITKLPSDVEAFIRSKAPTVRIDHMTVQPIEIEDFHKVSERLREMQENLLKENMLLGHKIAQLSKKPHLIGDILDIVERRMAPTPSHSTPMDQDKLPAKILTTGGSTQESAVNTATSVLSERIDNFQWGEAFTFDSESENKRVVNTSGCLNWIWADFTVAKEFVKKLKRPWKQLKNWWKPQQRKSRSSDRDNLQTKDGDSTSGYSALSAFTAAQEKQQAGFPAPETVVDIRKKPVECQAE